MKKAIVIGSGAGGATAAKELQGKFDVTVLEAGKEFRPFNVDLRLVDAVRKTGLLFDERLVPLIFPPMRIRKSDGKMVVVNGSGTGGTTTLCTANGIRHDAGLKRIGINLDEEFDELSHEVPLTTAHRSRWHEQTRRVFEICEEMRLEPMPTPKMAHEERCAACGRCVFGCRRGAKWDSREFLDMAVARGAQLVSGCFAEKVVIDDGRARGVLVSESGRRRFIAADLIVVAAGGLGTPEILRESGIPCEERLFVDPVLCVAAKCEGADQNREIPMPFVVQREHFILSPYFDYLSFYFNRSWKYPAGDIYSLMIKLADSNTGGISGKRISKNLTAVDRERLEEGIGLCREIFRRLGVKDDAIFLGTLNGGHPGGMLPLTEREAETFHHDALPVNLFVADATLFPESLGFPPILTIMAMAKRVSRKCIALA